MDSTWRKCNSCKNPISFLQKYFICNVSTCTRSRTGFVFCSVSCWDAHLPLMNHREAWAEEKKAPSRENWAKVQKGEMEDETFRRTASPSEDEKSRENESPIEKRSTPSPAKVILRKRTTS